MISLDKSSSVCYSEVVPFLLRSKYWVPSILLEQVGNEIGRDCLNCHLKFRMWSYLVKVVTTTIFKSDTEYRRNKLSGLNYCSSDTLVVFRNSDTNSYIPRWFWISLDEHIRYCLHKKCWEWIWREENVRDVNFASEIQNVFIFRKSCGINSYIQRWYWLYQDLNNRYVVFLKYTGNEFGREKLSELT